VIEEKRLHRSGSRVPPGQTVAAGGRWPVLHFGPTPKFDRATWDLRLFGLVGNESVLRYDAVRSIPSVDRTSDIHCVTGWSRLGDTWTGAPASTVLSMAQVLPEARYVIAHCEFGYRTSIPLAVFDDDDVLLCWARNAEDLTAEHGFPLRLLVPKKYFWKSAKWLRGLEFSAENRLGFWEQRGYHDGADPWIEQRYW
jgi:DMSO/TMAO reductase YedYZ molybdopterin-dependent catalytic subunit